MNRFTGFIKFTGSTKQLFNNFRKFAKDKDLSGGLLLTAYSAGYTLGITKLLKYHNEQIKNSPKLLNERMMICRKP